MRSYAYASTPDILAHLAIATAFTPTSRPNATQVHHQIYNAADELDGALRAAKYGVPIPTSATAATDQLNHWNAIGGAMFVAAAHPAGRDSKHLEFLERRWNAILTGIREGDLVLDGVSKDSTTSLPRFRARSATGDGASPYFTRDTLRDA